MKFLSSWRSGSTLRLATRVDCKLNLPVNCRFASILDCRLDLPLEVKPRKAWGLRGEDGLLPLGCRHPCHSLQATLSSLAMVLAASGGVGTCEFLRSQSSQHTPHMCQFLQRTRPRRVGRTAPVRIKQVCSPSRRERDGRCASYRTLTREEPPEAATMGKVFLFFGTPPPPPPPPPPFGALPPTGRRLATRSAIAAGRIGPVYRPPSSSTRIGSREKGTLDPGASSTYDADATTHLLRYWIHRRDTSKRSVVDR